MRQTPGCPPASVPKNPPRGPGSCGRRQVLAICPRPGAAGGARGSPRPPLPTRRRGAGRGRHRRYPPRAGQGGLTVLCGGTDPAERKQDEATLLPKKQRDGSAQPCHRGTLGGGKTREPQVAPCPPPAQRGGGTGAVPGQEGFPPRRIGPGATRGASVCPPRHRGTHRRWHTRGDTRSSPAPPRRRGISAWCRGLPEKIPPQSPAGTPGTTAASGGHGHSPHVPRPGRDGRDPPRDTPNPRGDPISVPPASGGDARQGPLYLPGAPQVRAAGLGGPGGCSGGGPGSPRPPLAATAPASPDKAAAPGSPCASPTRSAQPKDKAAPPGCPRWATADPRSGPPGGDTALPAAPGTITKPSASGGLPKLAHALVEPRVPAAGHGSPPTRCPPSAGSPAVDQGHREGREGREGPHGSPRSPPRRLRPARRSRKGHAVPEPAQSPRCPRARLRSRGPPAPVAAGRPSPVSQLCL